MKILRICRKLFLKSIKLVTDGERDGSQEAFLPWPQFLPQETNTYSGNKIESLFTKHTQAQSCKQAPN